MTSQETASSEEGELEKNYKEAYKKAKLEEVNKKEKWLTFLDAAKELKVQHPGMKIELEKSDIDDLKKAISDVYDGLDLASWACDLKLISPENANLSRADWDKIDKTFGNEFYKQEWATVVNMLVSIITLDPKGKEHSLAWKLTPTDLHYLDKGIKEKIDRIDAEKSSWGDDFKRKVRFITPYLDRFD